MWESAIINSLLLNYSVECYKNVKVLPLPFLKISGYLEYFTIHKNAIYGTML